MDDAVRAAAMLGTKDEEPPWAETRERAACGIGLIADEGGVASHRVLALALEALGNLAHRGAVGADGETSDGTGILTAIPWRLLAREIPRLAGRSPADLALAAFFLWDGDLAGRRRFFADQLAASGLRVLAWRRVHVDPAALGALARSTLPTIWQAVIERPADVAPGEDFERLIYLARRRLERALAASPGAQDPVVVSFSSRTVVYKSMAAAGRLRSFYRDLQSALFETSVALFHQRFSTNTRPSWRLAQPFHLLAHNGEINTLEGNYHWMRTREPELRSALWGERMAELLPLLDAGLSDSAQLDQMLELLLRSGRSLHHALAMLMPAARRQDADRDPALRAFYDYHATLVEPWDGPAAVVLTDGRWALAGLDRNGLRPQRFWRTREGLLILGSEVGIVAVPPEDVIERGRLGPGEMLAVDLEAGRLWRDAELKSELAARQPYGRWLQEQVLRPPPERSALDHAARGSAASENPGRRFLQRLFGYSVEALERIFDPMLDGQQPTGSMGNDAPPAVLSRQPALLYSYFKQRFAQVTNPPLDPLRERRAFSLDTCIGAWGNLLDERPEAAHLVHLGSPLLTTAELSWLSALDEPAFRWRELAAHWLPDTGAAGLERAVEALADAAERAVDEGITLLCLHDRGAGATYAPIPMLLAVAAVHRRLVDAQKRMRLSLIVDTGEPREDHHIACLLGFGATAVHPWLAYATAAERSIARGSDPRRGVAAYRAALEQGLLKVLSRLGVGSIASYHGAQLFDVLGLERTLVDRYFRGARSALGGIGMEALAAHAATLHAEAMSMPSPAAAAGGPPPLQDRGFFRFRKGGERHAFAPSTFKLLHRAVRRGDREAYADYARQIDEAEPARLRDLLGWRSAGPALELGAIEPAAAIVGRCVTAAMSLGSLSREAHEAIAVAMNRLGGRSSSGEGGEAAQRSAPYVAGDLPTLLGAWQPEPGDAAGSAIKQVASGRFGVTPFYLRSAQELEIKMAQGSKPGEGGQIPGFKVTAEIAALRHATPGTPLISPAPHHDIYSIEDLAQLIWDLKRVHPTARVAVKLVSTLGVGTIAMGVAKAGADTIQISGEDGGTGASPLSSIKHAGLPWEIGLAEAHRRLIAGGLRDRVALRVDGGLKTGRDVVLAALLGAEEFGFGSVPLVALGCVMARQCHLDTCPVGIATQRPELRRRFAGSPDGLIAFFAFLAEQVRLILAEIGLPTLGALVGRGDLLDRRGTPESGLDVLALTPPAWTAPASRPPRSEGWLPPGLDQEIADDLLLPPVWAVMAAGGRYSRTYPIGNGDRTVGARLAGEIAVRTGGRGLSEGSIRLDLRGVAGQSFGAFATAGMELCLWGDAQDGVGKGLAGGRLIVRPATGEPAAAPPLSPVLAGNAVLYGATGGELYVAGRVGERFAVRNSGATAVVEGCGDHGCEYMTAGLVVVLGPVGDNFGAGMSGGVAYVWDPHGELRHTLNRELVEDVALDSAGDVLALRRCLVRHGFWTASRLARQLLASWRQNVGLFRRIAPRPALPFVQPAPLTADAG